MSVKRATVFINRVLVATVAILIAIIVLAAVENLFHPFTPYLNQAIAWLERTERLLSKNSIMGISFGMVALTLLVCLFPLLMPRVNKKQYRTNTVRGVIASVVFFFSQLLYDWAERYGKLHLIGAMLVAIVITMLVIEFLSLLTRIDEEVSLRTDLLSAAASGLASGIVLKLLTVVAAQARP
jgi:uncharacterized BrkB/YihY/UPF0761 family membrane protein